MEGLNCGIFRILPLQTTSVCTGSHRALAVEGLGVQNDAWAGKPAMDWFVAWL